MSASTTLADLTKPLTVDEASAVLYSALANRGVDVTAWKAGSVVRTIVAGLAIIVAAFSDLVSKIAASGFLSLSKGVWLRLVALYVYGVTASDGAFATGTITLTNGGGGVFTSVPIGNLVVKNATTGKTYRNTAVFSLGAMGTVNVAIQADEIGSASTSVATAIATMVSTMNLVTCSNAAAVVGVDPDDDETVRLLCAEKLGTLSPDGAPDAYAFIARTAKDSSGVSIGVTRVRTIPDGIGGLDLYVATPTGGVTGSTGPSVGNLGAIDDLIQSQVVPRGITCRTHTATTVSIATTYELWIPSTNTQTDDEVKAAVDAALLAFLSTRDIGGDVIPSASGKVYLTAIEDVVGGAIPGTKKRAVTVPSGDTSIGTTAAPIMGANTCTAIHRVVGSSL